MNSNQAPIKKRGRKPFDEPLEPLKPVKDAIKEIPQDMLDRVTNYKSLGHHRKKLNQEQQLELMELIARFANLEQVNEHFFSNYKIVISPALVRQYRFTKKWKPVIQKLREKYLLNMDEVAISHKRVRLDMRQRIYDKTMSKEEYKTALHAIKDSEEEVKDKTIQGHVNLTLNQYNLMSDEEIEFRKNELLKKLSAKKVIDIPKENNNVTIQE